MTKEALRRVVVEYIKAVMQKRMSFKNADERREGAERMIREADQFSFLFRKLAAVSFSLSLHRSHLGATKPPPPHPPERCTVGQLLPAAGRRHRASVRRHHRHR